MSATKHGVACHCPRCHDFNTLHGRANKLVSQMLEAKKAGKKDEELEALCIQLEHIHSQIAKLGAELNR